MAEPVNVSNDEKVPVAALNVLLLVGVLAAKVSTPVVSVKVLPAEAPAAIDELTVAFTLAVAAVSVAASDVTEDNQLRAI